MRCLICLGLMFLLVLAVPARGREPDPFEGLHHVTLDEISPHVAWGKPLEGGPIRTLFIAPRFTLRDAVELAERLELDFETAPVWDSRHLGGELDGVSGLSAEEAAAALRDALGREHDLIVVGNLELAVLPEDVLASIAARVKEGAGLILAYHLGGESPAPRRENLPPAFQQFLDGATLSDKVSEITRGVGASMTPEWPSSLGFVKASTCEKGRIVELDYGGERPFSHFLAPPLTDPAHARPEYFDVYLSLVAKAARWAAGRTPRITVARVEEGSAKGPSDAEIPPGLPEEYVQTMRDAVMAPLFHSFQIGFSGPAEKTYRICAQVREPNRGLRLIYPTLPPLRKGSSSYVLDLPIGPGQYFLDLWVLDKKAVVEWHTEPVAIKGWPEISDVAYSKGYLQANDVLTVSLDVRAQYHLPRPCTVYVRAVDSLERIVAEGRQLVPSEGGRTQVALNFADLLSNLVKIEVFAIGAELEHPTRWDLDHAAYTHTYLPVRAPRPVHEFSFAVETRDAVEYNVRGFTRTLARLGVDAAHVAANDEARFFLVEAGLQPIPELTRYVPDAINGNVRRPCLLDAAIREADDKKLKEQTTAFWTVGTNVYSLGKGNCLAAPGEDVCHCPACLEAFHVWLETSYQDVANLNRAWNAQFTEWSQAQPVDRETARASQVYAPWLDFRLFMDGVFTNAHVHAAEVIRSVDRDARAGFRAEPGSDADLGYDWRPLASRLTALALEADAPIVESVRSYRPPNAYTALCFGGVPSANTPACGRWYPWYAALHGLQAVWHAAPFGGSMLDTPVTALAPDGVPTPVFLETSAVVRELKNGLGALLAAAQRAKAKTAIYDSQSSLYLSQIDSSLGQSARDAQAAFIRLLDQTGRSFDFVSSVQAAQGGLKEYALLILPMARAIGDDEAESIRAFAAQGGRIIADVAPGEFDAHGTRRPAFPLDDLFGVRQNDKGFATLLNHRLPSPDAVDDDLILLFDSLLERAGVERTAPIMPAKGRVLRGESFAFRYGDADIVALLGAPNQDADAQKIILRRDRDRFYYDLRTGKPIPGGKKRTLRLAPGDAALIASLPYAVTGVSVASRDSVFAGRRLPVRVRVDTRGGETPGTHLVRVTLSRRFSAPLPWYAQDVTCVKGEATLFIPLALSDLPGLYTVAARDVLTGATGQTVVKVDRPQ